MSKQTITTFEPVAGVMQIVETEVTVLESAGGWSLYQRVDATGKSWYATCPAGKTPRSWSGSLEFETRVYKNLANTPPA